MSVKERIIKMMQDAGYDTISACEHTTQCLREFKESGKASDTFHIRNGKSFTLRRNVIIS